MFLRRYFTLWTLGLLALLSSFVYTPTSFAITGDGSPETPYTLASCADLLLLDGATYDETLNYEITETIDCSGETAVFPLFNGATFSGTFEGNDFTISGLAESHTSSNIAMFSSAINASIQNFTLEGSITSTDNSVAGLVVDDQGGNDFTNIHVFVDISGGAYIIGGVVGSSVETLDPSQYTEVHYSGSITSTDETSAAQNFGGFGAFMESGIIQNSSVTTTFFLDEHEFILDLGGFIGHAENITVNNTNVTSTLDIHHSLASLSNVGGLIGAAYNSILDNATVTFNLTAGDAEALRGQDFYNIGGFVGLMESSAASEDNLITFNTTLFAENISFLGGYGGHLCGSNDPETDCLDIIDLNSIEGAIELNATDNIYNVGGFAGIANYLDISDASVNMDMDMTGQTLHMIGGLLGASTNNEVGQNTYTGRIDIHVHNSETGVVYNIGGIAGYAEADELFASSPVNNFILNQSNGVMVIGGPSAKVNNVSFIGGSIGGGSGGLYTQNYANIVMVLYGNDILYNVGGFLGGLDVNDLNLEISENAFYGEVIVENDINVMVQFVGGFAGSISKAFGDAELILRDSFASGLLISSGSIAGFIGNLSGDYASSTVTRLYTDMSLYSFDDEGFAGFAYNVSAIPLMEDIIVATKFENEMITGDAGVILHGGATDLNRVYYNDTSMQDTQCGDEFTLDEEFLGCFAYNTDGTEDDLFVNTSAEPPLDNWNFESLWQTSNDAMPLLRTFGEIFDTDINNPENLEFNFEEASIVNNSEPLEFSFDIAHLNRFKNFYYVISFHLAEPEESPSLVYESEAVNAGSHTYTFGDDTGTYTLGDPDTLEDGDYYVSLQVFDEFDNETDRLFFGEGSTFLLWLDRTAPVITEETPIAESIYESSATYTFHMDNGEELHVEDCAPTISATELSMGGSVSVLFNDLVLGETYSCDIYVADEAGNISNILTAGPFTYTTAPRRSGGGGGGGGKARPSESRTSESTTSVTETLVLDSEMSYEEEVSQAFALGILTKEGTKEANKCEALMMMSRVLEWELVATENAPFSDVPAWCYDVAAYAKAKGIAQGRGENLLGLDTPLSRYEFVTLFIRAIEQNLQDLENLNLEVPFKDTIISWADRYVRIAYALDLVKGFADGTFGGEESILKQDLAIILMRNGL